MQPNPAHCAIARLEATGRGHGVVTQNIDGLHQLAGSTEVVEIHGTAREVMCIGHSPRHGVPDGCGFTAPYTWAFERLDAGDPDPSCPMCGGLVKSSTVSFGQVLLPGVGVRYEFTDRDGNLVGVVARRDGEFEVVVYDAASIEALRSRLGETASTSQRSRTQSLEDAAREVLSS